MVVLTIDIIGSTSTETPENLADFMQTNGYTFPVLLDENFNVARSYEVKSTPTNLLIGKDGIIRERQTGAFSEEELEEKLSQLLAE